MRILEHSNEIERFAFIALQLTNEVHVPEVVRFFDGAD